MKIDLLLVDGMCLKFMGMEPGALTAAAAALEGYLALTPGPHLLEELVPEAECRDKRWRLAVR